MIRIICGTCETALGYKTRADGELTLPAAQEKRLVERGVAEYVTRPIINPASDADGPVDGGDGDGAGIDPSHEDPPVEGLENGGSEVPAGFVSPFTEQLEIVDGHYTRESLLDLTRQQMEALALALDVNISRCKNKGDIADLLVEVEVAAPAEDSGEAPPELSAEAPVV